METKEKNVLYYIGNSEGQREVRFLIKKKWEKCITEFKGITDRMASLRVNIGKRYITIFQIYASTSESSEGEIERFYEVLTRKINKQRLNDQNVIISHCQKEGRGRDINGCIQLLAKK